MSNEGIGREAAEQVRAEAGLGGQPVPSVERVIEAVTGAGVMRVPATRPGHGMTMRHGDRILVAVSCTPHPMRLRSTLAHELGHIRLDTIDRPIDAEAWSTREPAEIQADAFARHLLLPRESAARFAEGRPRDKRLLSDLVQEYRLSPTMAAIQLRESGVIGLQVSEEWARLSTRQLATRFGWDDEYRILAAAAQNPCAPQRLLARAVEGYRMGLVEPALIARLRGIPNVTEIVASLASEGIEVEGMDLPPVPRPPDTGRRLHSPPVDANGEDRG